MMGEQGAEKPGRAKHMQMCGFLSCQHMLSPEGAPAFGTVQASAGRHRIDG